MEAAAFNNNNKKKKGQKYPHKDQEQSHHARGLN